jgi:cytochrome c nitrite reductase small subunit
MDKPLTIEDGLPMIGSLRTWFVWLLTLRFVGVQWRAVGFASLGTAAGLGAFVFHVSRAASYLSDQPETCANCHVMATHYLTWQHSSHARVATCNDCHVPHGSVLTHYAFKARDGLWHATVFTLRWEPQAIRLSPGAVGVVQENCRRCHAAVVDEVAAGKHTVGDPSCWDCHRDVPHGRVRSLSATPGVFQPGLPPVTSRTQEPTIGGRPARPSEVP